MPLEPQEIQGPSILGGRMGGPFVVSVSNHERTGLRQAQAERMEGKPKDLAGKSRAIR